MVLFDFCEQISVVPILRKNFAQMALKVNKKSVLRPFRAFDFGGGDFSQGWRPGLGSIGPFRAERSIIYLLSDRIAEQKIGDILLSSKFSYLDFSHSLLQLPFWQVPKKAKKSIIPPRSDNRISHRPGEHRQSNSGRIAYSCRHVALCLWPFQRLRSRSVLR